MSVDFFAKNVSYLKAKHKFEGGLQLGVHFIESTNRIFLQSYNIFIFP